MPDELPDTPPSQASEYRVRSYSLYAHDLAAIDRVTAALRARGLKGINRSRVLRIAIAKLEAELDVLDLNAAADVR